MLRRLIEWSTRDWALKLTALALAFLLWTMVRGEAPGTWTARDIPVRVVNYSGDWVVAEPPSPESVTIVFRGPLRELLRAASERPSVIVPVEDVRDTTMVFQLQPNWVRMPPGTGGTSVVENGFRPAEVRLVFDRVSTRLIPVAVALVGEPPAGYALLGPAEIEPAFVRASGARRDLTSIDTLRLPAIDLRDRRSLDTLQMTIDTVGTGLIIAPRTIRVVLPIRPILEGAPGDVRPPPRR